ncbi:MAG: glycosyltransferase [Acetobacteraceae bacterium]
MTRRCLMLAPYPLAQPRHGGQVRAASLRDAMAAAGWQVTACGIYPAAFFPPEQRGADDLPVEDPALPEAARAEMQVADLVAARAAAADAGLVARLARLIERTAPDLVLVEQPWPLLPLRAAGLPGAPLVYSSQNIEWRLRAEPPREGMGGDPARHAAEVRAIEEAAIGAAALVLSISDTEEAALREMGARRVVTLPPVSDLAGLPPAPGHYARAAEAEGIAYAAMIGSAYWPNVDGFFAVFGEGLGFLPLGRRVLVAGRLGQAILEDPRWRHRAAVNTPRFTAVGEVDLPTKHDLFAGSRCVPVPVLWGGGAKLKTADALACGRVVVATRAALDGYGAIVAPHLGRGVFVADEPLAFRRLVRDALEGALPEPEPSLAAAMGPARLAEGIGAALAEVARG